MNVNMNIRHGLIVEDLPDSADWLENILSETFSDIQIASAASVKAAKSAIKDHTFQIALVDLGLPDGSGIDVITELSKKSPQCIIIVSSIFDDDQHLFSALRAGAKGYVLKDLPKQELAEMLKGIANGKPPLSPAIARRLLNFFQPEVDSPTTEQLTHRENEVLQLIAKGYTIAKAAESLGITRNTAAGYVKIIYRKLNVSSRAEATLEASRRGIISIDSQ